MGADEACVALLVRYPLSSTIVLAAVAAVASVFLFARPQYHPPGQGSEVKVDLSKYPAASDGWAWDDVRPVYDDLMAGQIAEATEKRGHGDLAALLASGETWTIADGS